MTAGARFAPRRTPPFERLLSRRIAITGERLAYAAIFAAAIGLRLWDLGARALHHDESIHAQWSWELLQGNYTHDPIFHGPFYYHVQGLTFLLFGTSDYTARLSAALFGIGLVFLPLLLRRWLGRAGTMAAVAFIAFSPTIVYFSRFFREDIYMAFFTLAMVAAMWRYVASGRERWLIVFALALTGSITTKEATYLTTATFLVFLSAQLGVDLARGYLAPRELDETWRRIRLAAPLALVGWAYVSLWAVVPRFRKKSGYDRLPRSGDLLLLLGTMILPLLTPFLKVPIEHFGLVEQGRLKCRVGLPQRDVVALAGLFLTTTSAAAFVGLQWRARTWAIAMTASALIYLTLMTSLWTNLGGLCTGPWGSLDYWLTQQDYARGQQPWFYYDMLMPAYEFLTLGICIGGLWWSVVRGNAFSRFLVLWLVGMWASLSWAGEKMPWLNTHIALPAAVLAAWTVQRAWQAWDPRPPASRMAWAIGGAAAVAAGAALVAVYLPGENIGTLVIRLVAVVGAANIVAYAALPFGRRGIPTFVLAAFIGAMTLFSLRTMVTVSFIRGDTPKDLLVYTQSSPRIPELRDEIDALAEATGQGYDLPIAVDTSDSFAWPWAWYLRDYRHVTYTDFTNAMPQGDFAVLLVNVNNLHIANDAVAAATPPRFGNPVRYPLRWWFDETYKQALPTGPWEFETWKTVLGGSLFGTWASYWRDHDPHRASGSVDAMAFFPANYDRATGTFSARPLDAAKPTTDRAGRPTFGGIGTLPGMFFAPVDIETDAAGSLYVIDATSHRLQKFDAAGNFIAAIDIRVNPKDAGEQSQPWGLAVGPAGQVAVADTFGWRVRVFDKDLKSTLTFGRAPDLAKGLGDYDLYGPRDIAIDREGNFWVADTGDARVMVYSAAGQFIRQVGSRGSGPGQFDEPTGIAIGSDGTVYVGDAYNKRVVMLRPDGTVSGSFTVPAWTSTDPADKPYLRPLRDGRIAVSLPNLNEVRIYDRAGVLAGTIHPTDDPLSRPYGIVEAGDGRLWVVEGGSGRVRLFSLP